MASLLILVKIKLQCMVYFPPFLSYHNHLPTASETPGWILWDYFTAKGNEDCSDLHWPVHPHPHTKQALEATNGYCCPITYILISKAEPLLQLTSSVTDSVLLTVHRQPPTLSFILPSANHCCCHGSRQQPSHSLHGQATAPSLGTVSLL